MSATQKSESPASRRFRFGDPVGGLVGLLAAYRLIYHLFYLRDIPFSVATFSDGRAYEMAALDLLKFPPLGSEPFYLQGIYAYFLSVPMALIRPWVSLGMLMQLAVAAFGIWLFTRVLKHLFGRRDARWSAVVYLAYPMLMFYENKYLTASLAVFSLIVLLWAVVVATERRTPKWWTIVGFTVGIAMLWRPNFAILIPFVAWGVWDAEDRVRSATLKTLGWCALGGALALGPMVARNVAVTGQATPFPAHGGGTSFYIGNNARATGVWNDAGGLLSGEVLKERGELMTKLDLHVEREADEAAAIGRALYQRAFSEISADPGRWLALEAKKVWLLVGNDELTQDYDLHGEIAMMPFAHRVGLPYAVLQIVGLLGLVLLTRRSREEPKLRPWVLVLWGIVASTVAANVLYFTSSQHRLPLALVWASTFLVGARLCLQRLRDRKFIVPVVVAIAIGVCFVPRTKKRAPSAVFFYNLSLAYTRLGDEPSAGWALDRAVELRPDHPVIRLERARFKRAHGLWEEAIADIEAIEAMPQRPKWVDERVRQERVYIFGPDGR